MNNPFKIIGISILVSVLVIFSFFKLPKMLLQFDQSQWLAGMIIAILITISILVSMLRNAQKIQRNINLKSNH